MRTRGFTLIELMIVVAIIGILAAIAIPNFSRFQSRSKQAEAKTWLKAMYTGAKARYAEKQDYGDASTNAVFADISFTTDASSRYMYVYGAATWTIKASNAIVGTGGGTVTCSVGTSVVSAPTNQVQNFAAQACCNLDNDSFVDTWMINDGNILHNGAIDPTTTVLPAIEDGNDVIF